MKLCIPCSAKAEDNVICCPRCGEASWLSLSLDASVASPAPTIAVEIPLDAPAKKKGE